MRSLPALVVTIGIASALLTGCTPGVEPIPSPTPSDAEVMIGEPGAPGCDPASPVIGNVIEGTGVGATIATGLIETASLPALAVGDPTKLVLQMTGSGELSAELAAPDGSPRELDWGPEAHSSSNFGGGDEWGVGFTLDTPGCWVLELHRAGGEQATFWLVAT